MRNFAYFCALGFIFVVPLEKTVVVAGLGSLAKIVGILVALSWLVSAVIVGRLRSFDYFHILFFLFILWNLLSVLWSLDADSSLERIQTWFQLGILSIVIWDLFDNQDKVRLGLQAYVLGAWVSVAGTFFNFFASTQFVYGRYSASGLHVVDLGVVLALGIPLAWYLIVSNGEKKGLDRLLYFINILYLPAACIAIALTGSRGAMVAALPSVAFVFFSLGRLSLLARGFFMIIALSGLVVGWFLIPASSLDRLASTYTELTAGGSMSGRVELWREGFELYARHPIVGIGTNAYKTTVELGQVAHNTFLSVLVELGVVGLLIFVAILVTVSHRALQQSTLESRLWIAILLSWLLGASTLTHEHYKTTWLFMSFIVLSANNYQTTLDQDQAEG